MRSMLLMALLVACGDKGDSDNGGGGGGGDDSTSGTGLEAVCTEPTEVTCVDEMILDLSLQDNRTSNGDVISTADGDDTVTDVDASAGGYDASSRNAWTYLKFSTDGVAKVDLDDESALESMDWDLALKRYIIRMNSKDSGPSCVSSAAMFGFEYSDLSEVPEGLTWQQDDFYSDDCTLVVDSVGGAQVAMAPWWEYSACVATTRVPFLIQLADGHVLKIVVEKYYLNEADQDTCDRTGSVPMGTEGGYIRLRWRMLQ